MVVIVIWTFFSTSYLIYRSVIKLNLNRKPLLNYTLQFKKAYMLLWMSVLLSLQFHIV